MFYNIQALRGVAALLVVMHHALPHFKAMNLSNPIFEFIGKFGYMGVDIFFVISGFVMAKTTINVKQNPSSSMNFISKRFLRIYLGFWSIFFLALLYFYYFDPSYLKGKEILQSLFLINANMFDLVVSPAWSLTYELYFYILVAIVLVSTKINPRMFFVTLLSAIVFKLLVTNIGNNKFLDFFFSSLIFEFVAGYFLYVYLDVIKNKKYLILSVIIALLFFFSAIYFNIGYGYQRVLTFGCFAFSLVWLVVLLEKHKIFIIKGLLVKIGDASYTLYLSHTILLGAFYTLGLRTFFVNNEIAMIGFLSYIIFIIVFSMVFYKYIELPMYSKIKQRYLDK